MGLPLKGNVKFIDLFAGMGGIRLGFENIMNQGGYSTECVMTSEIKPGAIETLKYNFKHNLLVGNIFDILNNSIPDFDFLLAGFPCQPFSISGKGDGFLDTRGTLFFEIERILRCKKPYGFILENVEGLVKHNILNKKDDIGATLKTILNILEIDLGYKVTWKVFDSLEFGVPQSRKRIFIVGTKDQKIDLDGNIPTYSILRDILEAGLEPLQTEFTKKLLSQFKISELYGKSIKDKRGGVNNIHSWDIGVKGIVSEKQCLILNKLFKERRKKHWSQEIGIDWMDGIPLTLDQIKTFIDISEEDLKILLDDLVNKKYLKFEHPKKLVKEYILGGIKKYREYDPTKSKGYNIITGKLSFDINKILDPNNVAPTIVATDASKLAVPDGMNLRRLSTREGLRLFGYPEWYNIPSKKCDIFDLLGNTVTIPVVEFITSKIYERLK
jgi:DNA (cytosine-5)-methyltransferase 1